MIMIRILLVSAILLFFLVAGVAFLSTPYEELELQEQIIMPTVACTASEIENRLHIACETTSWGQWEIYHVLEDGLDFKSSDMYNDSIGIVFSTNPDELFVVFRDEYNTKTEFWLQIDSDIRSCVPDNGCFIP